MAFITLTPENVMSEHLCCAIADKKHQTGVNDKRNWLAERIKEGHVFRKLDAQGKVFIEYAPLEKAWVPVTGDNYFISIACGYLAVTKERDTERNCYNRASTTQKRKENPASASFLPKRRNLSYQKRSSC